MIDLVVIILAASVPITTLAVVVERAVTGKGIGVRAIQFVAATTIMPIIFIMASYDFLENQTIASLTGAFIGYLFSHISNFDMIKNDRDSK